MKDIFYEIPVHTFQTNPFQSIGKDWMLITAQKDKKANTMTASWGGFGVMWNKNVAFIVIRPQRYTKEFVDISSTFSLTFFPQTMKKELSYLGTISGKNENKIEKAKLTLIYDNETPYFEEAHTVLICKKLYTQPYEENCFLENSLVNTWYPEKDFHTLYIAEIEKILVKKEK